MNNEYMKEAVSQFPEKIQEPYREFFEQVGYDVLNVFFEQFGGTFMYVPTPKSVFSKCIQTKIRNEFNGGNIKELARKYRLSERTLRKYIRENREVDKRFEI